MDEDGS